jgi:hypothetical protein
LSSQTFLTYGDADLYFLAPGGDFNLRAPDWVLEDGASATGSALELPAGATATSPAICVAQGYPHGRMLGAAVGERAKARVRVGVIYNGDQREGSTKLKLRGEMAPTERFALDESAFGLDPVTGTASIKLVFESAGPATALLDDVYIDPRARN